MAPGIEVSNGVPSDVHIANKKGASVVVDDVEVVSPPREWVPKSDDDHAVLAIRNLVCDVCMQHNGGHAASALGMAAIGVALWKHNMKFNPCDPDWFDRDRFVLSNGKFSGSTFNSQL